MLKFFSRKSSELQDINWNVSRYSTIVAQRNVLLLLTLMLSVAITISVLVVFKVSTSSTIEPFVIEIEKKSGIVQLVDPVTVKQYSADETLNNHFMVEYIKVREVFNSYSYKEDHEKVRLFSSATVYREFSQNISSQDTEKLANLYSDFVKTDFKVRSIQRLNDNQTYQLRFSIIFTRKDGSSTKKNRIVIMSYRYAPLELDDQARYINPLGFQVISYRVDDEYV
ncbi:MAG: type IV secretion system protein [Wolbachia endosymbiont of Tyrophagus putrescentiae]|nr:type IV secretion system protein [Wolbachia endosymbiont of Tyrophagus putrescentiae]